MSVIFIALRSCSSSAVVVLRSDDAVLAQVAAKLYFNDFHRPKVRSASAVSGTHFLGALTMLLQALQPRQ